jgi:ABC-type Mn2+/Zn2+ transport system ATPase subunit
VSGGDRTGVPALRVRGLKVRAGGREILRVDELELRRGELLAVLGPNGSGKSTLVRACLGLLRPAAGQAEVLGEPVGSLAPAALRRLRRRIGYVPQALSAHGEMPLSCREVVAAGRTARAGLLRRLRREDWRAVDLWLERLGLSSLADQRYADCSGGEQRKCLIARAMCAEPELLVLDEPAANLDLRWREGIVRTLEDLVGSGGATTLLVCHELEVLPAATARVLLLGSRPGGVCGPIERVLTEEAIRALYGPGLRPRREGRRWAAVPTGGEGSG